jgi:hypothetical protein
MSGEWTRRGCWRLSICRRLVPRWTHRKQVKAGRAPSHTVDSAPGAERRTQLARQDADPQSGHKARGLERNGFGHGNFSGNEREG